MSQGSPAEFTGRLTVPRPWFCSIGLRGAMTQRRSSSRAQQAYSSSVRSVSAGGTHRPSARHNQWNRPPHRPRGDLNSRAPVVLGQKRLNPVDDQRGTLQQFPHLLFRDHESAPGENGNAFVCEAVSRLAEVTDSRVQTA